MALMIRMRDRMQLHPHEPLLAGVELDRAVEAAVLLGPAHEEAVRAQFNRQFMEACRLGFPEREKFDD